MPAYLLEVRTEELPAEFVASAISQWRQHIPYSLKQVNLNAEAIEIYGTPRRLAILIKGLPDKQPDVEEEIKGPPAEAAYKNGEPTTAAIGFARKQGVDITFLTLKDTGKGQFVFLLKKTPGQPTTDILTKLTPQWITHLQGKRFMRWGDGELRFPRPIINLVALWEDKVLDIELVSGSTRVYSSRTTYGHRVLHPQPVTIANALSYVETLHSAYVQCDANQRRETIRTQIQQSAAALSAVAEVPPNLLEEVTNLVEWPTAIVGDFDEDFLQLPPEVIITVMVTHQRYFPLKKEGSLLAKFITIANGDPSKGNIIKAGNERVIRARLADAEFFYKADCSEHLDTFIPQLEDVTFQEELGTIRDKVDRLLDISGQVAEQLELTSEQKRLVESTTLLCKADLVTQMVYEFPELQGIMGQKYALVSGENPLVAQGIYEHYLPKGAEDSLPQSLTGQIVGISDRLDTLVGIFGIGMIPSGSSDPFALRRAANSIINITWHGQLGINLDTLLSQTVKDFLSGHPEKISPLGLLRDFFAQRLRTLLQDELHLDYDLVNALLPENDAEYLGRGLENLLDLRDRALFLQQIRHNHLLDSIYETVNRSTRLAVKGDLDTRTLNPVPLINPELLQKPSEKAFYQALIELLPQTQRAQSQRNYQLLVDGLVNITPTVSRFFDGPDSVLVMDENSWIRQNRLNLLGLLRNHARVLADFGAIVKTST